MKSHRRFLVTGAAMLRGGPMTVLARVCVLVAHALVLVACSESPAGLPCSSGKLSGPWTAIQIPQLGGTVCSESVDGSIRIKHPGQGVVAHRDAYRAAFVAAGWTNVDVVTDNAAEFAADFRRADGSHELAVTIDRRGGLVELHANVAGPGWPAPPPEPGSLEEAIQRAHQEQQQNIQRAIDLDKHH